MNENDIEISGTMGWAAELGVWGTLGSRQALQSKKEHFVHVTNVSKRKTSEEQVCYINFKIGYIKHCIKHYIKIYFAENLRTSIIIKIQISKSSLFRGEFTCVHCRQ